MNYESVMKYVKTSILNSIQKKLVPVWSFNYSTKQTFEKFFNLSNCEKPDPVGYYNIGHWIWLKTYKDVLTLSPSKTSHSFKQPPFSFLFTAEKQRLDHIIF